MDRQEALRRLQASTAFEFAGDKVVVRDSCLLAAVADLKRERYTPHLLPDFTARQPQQPIRHRP